MPPTHTRGGCKDRHPAFQTSCTTFRTGYFRSPMVWKCPNDRFGKVGRWAYGLTQGAPMWPYEPTLTKTQNRIRTSPDDPDSCDTPSQDRTTFGSARVGLDTCLQKVGKERRTANTEIPVSCTIYEGDHLDQDPEPNSDLPRQSRQLQQVVPSQDQVWRCLGRSGYLPVKSRVLVSKRTPDGKR